MHLLPDAIHIYNEQLTSLSCKHPNVVSTSSLSSSCQDDGSLLPFFFFGVGFLLMLCIEQIAYQLPRTSCGPCCTKLGLCACPLQASSHQAVVEVVVAAEPVIPSKHEMIYLLTNNSKNSSCCTSSTTWASPSPLSPSSNKKEMPDDLEAAVETTVALAEQIDAWTVCFMFFISLSGHSIMEGVAIGSQMQPAWDIFIAVLAHKGLVAFALGFELLSTKHNLSTIQYMLTISTFTLMTPFGIFLGWLLVHGDSSSDDGNSLNVGVFTALSAGTFLYVSVVEIISHELKTHKHQCIKCTSLLVGFSVFGMLAKWV